MVNRRSQPDGARFSRSSEGSANYELTATPAMNGSPPHDEDWRRALHVHADYDLIAHVTRQPMQWIVPRETVP